MSTFFPQPPPFPMPFTTTVNGGATPNTAITQPVDNNLLSDNNTPSPSSSSSSSSSIIIVIIVIASAIIVSASIYLILRVISRRFHRSFRTYAAADDVVSHSAAATAVTENRCFDDRRSSEEEKLVDSLPLFTFGSVTGNLTGVDCAVCLSKFEKDDQLRLLPLCCHAFHSSCIDAWLVTNQTCPLCRSTVYPTDADVLSKVLAVENAEARGGNELRHNGSFRIEIGSVSRRRGTSDSDAGDGQRSYSIGSFEYIVDDGYELSVGSIHRRGVSECTDKESIGVPVPAPPGESIASDVSGGGRSWLRDYVDRIGSLSLSSRTMSFRSSGRFFNGSSRRNDIVVPIDDLEAGRVGEEISELFRWLSGV
ncbi:E3 ubiquitin-protein ligase ATL4-like [Nicotiana tabacum]|uniref:E3 ubiquitin-protein ligase ATL4-like n=3 Tax=Nicotiana TaxID=4085 RepID=A0AC58UTQ4_TOBAC|nr:PREDICTED: E3 ubiquitin-protein ligase ATL4 [Nicotiana sylvestris]XP_016475976.1 PREDICTED: E3 ubiquitin-protein ligase ATL4-like [Nicotiana tabacum]